MLFTWLLTDETSLDSTSPESRWYGRARAQRNWGVNVSAVAKSDTDFDFGTEQWDLVGLTYLSFRDLLAKIKPSLKNRGIVVIENFHRDTMRDRLLDEDATDPDNEFLQFCSAFRMLGYEDVVAKPDWGIESPQNRLVRLEAQRGNRQSAGWDWKGARRHGGAAVKWE